MILLDSGVLIANADRDDKYYDSCRQLLATHPGPLLATVPVITETAWMIESRLGPEAEASFLDSFDSGELIRVDLEDADWQRVAELIREYADLSLGTVDASTIAVAERRRLTTIATLNHRDFRVVRPRHVAGFEIVP